MLNQILNNFSRTQAFVSCLLFWKKNYIFTLCIMKETEWYGLLSFAGPCSLLTPRAATIQPWPCYYLNNVYWFFSALHTCTLGSNSFQKSSQQPSGESIHIVNPNKRLYHSLTSMNHTFNIIYTPPPHDRPEPAP